MKEEVQHLDTLKDIRQMMERSSRFISLSGLSGIAAGGCALIGAGFAARMLKENQNSISYRDLYEHQPGYSWTLRAYMGNTLFLIAAGVLIAALFFGFLFTYLRSRKTNTPIWGTQARRLIINVAIPMMVGGIYLLKLVENGNYGLIAPGCLIFYGLGLLNASRYTLGEVRYLAYAQIVLGIINLYNTGNGLFFWATGFGVLHIIYGAVMWWRYERNDGVK